MCTVTKSSKEAVADPTWVLSTIATRLTFLIILFKIMYIVRSTIATIHVFMCALDQLKKL